MPGDAENPSGAIDVNGLRRFLPAKEPAMPLRTLASGGHWLIAALALASCESAPPYADLAPIEDAVEAAAPAEPRFHRSVICNHHSDCIPPERCMSGCFGSTCVTPCRTDWDCPKGEECNCKGPGCRSWGYGVPFNHCWPIFERPDW